MSAVCSFTVAEVAEAQFALDHHPSSSPFWDSPSGEEALEVVVALDLHPATTESWRLWWHRDRMRASRDDPAWCEIAGVPPESEQEDLS